MRRPIDYLDINASNYFMYWRDEADSPYPPNHIVQAAPACLNETEDCLQRLTERTFYGLAALSGYPIHNTIQDYKVTTDKFLGVNGVVVP